MCCEERFFDGWSRVIAARFFLLMHLFTATWWQQGDINWNQKPIQPWIDIDIQPELLLIRKNIVRPIQMHPNMLVEDI